MTNPDSCAACGRPFPRPKGKTGRPRGCILPGGLPDKVITWLHANPEEELSAEDVSVKFTDGEVDLSDVRARLARSVEFGYIEAVTNERGRRVYRLPRAPK